jgi:succinoglycan biosynthesis protein ExoO
MTKSKVSVAVANRNGGRLLLDAVGSALRQDLPDLEVIVVDDGSDDDSAEAAERLFRDDSRLRVARLGERRGPGAARNRAFELAQGDWLAVLDSDDLMHPARLARLVGRAAADEADIVADDLVIFSDDGGPARRFLTGPRARAPSWVTAEAFVRESRLYEGRPNLGFLKPVIRRQAWAASGVRYDERLMIGEDHDLLLRLLTAGLRCRLDPFLGYFYRKHAASTSHRLTAADIAQIARAEAEHRSRLEGGLPRSYARALKRRRASIERAAAYAEAVGALKRRRPLEALAAVAQRPRAALLFRMPLAARARRLWRGPAHQRGPGAARPAPVCFITRQRVVGRTNGSSIYLLDLAEAVRRAGFEPHLVQASPVVVGRWPVLRLKREMKVFATISWRGLIAIGPFVFSTDPKVYAAAFRAAAAVALRRLRLPAQWLNANPAQHAPSAPWTDKDRLFVANSIARRSPILLADYAWQTEALAYGLGARARTAVIMHDLLHRRTGVVREWEGRPILPDRETETRLLARADIVVAIQKAEADEVRRLLPGRPVLTVPMTAAPASGPKPGRSDQVLFVGSNVQANVTGLAWMLELAWPIVRAQRPDAQLIVAGSVSRGDPPTTPGVRYVGFVERLDPYYDSAGVVVSPLTGGSGLKIKLIEALAHGKACVATSVTLQGVEEETSGAVALADTPDGFARAILDLLADEARRADLGRRALAAVATSFSAAACQGEFARWLRDETQPRPPAKSAQAHQALELSPAAGALLL